MITADDIDTLLFDVLGTVVDEAGEGAPWRSTDDLNTEALADALRGG